MTNTIRVALADDQDLVRTGLRMILSAEADLEVVGEAVDGVDAVAIARELAPDVLLMDIRMPHLDGIDATRRITRTVPATRVVMLTTFDRSQLVYDALVAGACGFLLKDMPREQLVGGVRAAARGEELLAPSITRRLIEEFTGTARRPPPGADQLTEREREVLGAGRPWTVERRDRRAALPRHPNRQDPRRPGAGQARRPRPRAGGRAGVRVRCDPAGRGGLTASGLSAA